jgi:hypothetical protein
MFGLRRKLARLEAEFLRERFRQDADRAHLHIEIERNNKLEKRVKELTTALEWHVGNSLELMLLEEKHIMRRVDEMKSKIKRVGDTGSQIMDETYNVVGSAVEQKLDEQIGDDTDKS